MIKKNTWRGIYLNNLSSIKLVVTPKNKCWINLIQRKYKKEFDSITLNLNLLNTKILMD